MRAIYALTIVCWIAVSANVSAASTIVHMHYANHNPTWFNWLQERADVYEALNPDIEIEFIVAAGTGVDQLLGMAAGGVLPDVTEFALSPGSTFADLGFFTDLRPFVERDPNIDLNMYPPIAPDATTWTDGELWGLPAEIYTAPVFFNKNLIEENGLAYPSDLGDDWNWDAVVEYGRKLSKDTTGDGQFDIKGLAGINGMWDHMAVVRQAGGSLFDTYKNPTKSLFNTPEVEMAIQWLVDLYRVHGVLHDGYSTGFRSGETAITFVSGPSAIELNSESGVNFDIALQPKGPASRAAYTVVNSFQIIKDSPNTEAAWEWIKFLAAEDESMEKFVAATGRLPALLSVAQYYGDHINNPPDNIYSVLLNVLDPDAFHLPIGKYASEARGLLPRAPLIRGEIDVRSALEEAHRRATAIFAEQ